MTLRNWITDLLNSLLSPEAAAPLISPTLLVLVAIISVASYFLCVRIVTPLTEFLTKKTETEWDDDILNENAMKAFSQLAPALILAWLLPQAFSNHQWGFVAIERVTKAYIVYAVVNLICVLISNTVDGFEKRDKGAEHNLTVIEGAVKLLLVLIGVIIGLSILFDKEPGMVLTGFGASAAVLMLVFQDTIKGFVAGVQLTLNNMLKKGDWIVCDKAGANGAVQSIKLTTVKVQNWDNSIVTIHPYTLISDSFRNYQNMRDMGARRVCRSIYVDFDSIRFLSRQEIERLKERRLITEEEGDERNEVNLTHFRKYLTRYLTEHPDVIKVHEDPSVIVMVRQLQPTPQGLPVELYFFTHITSWLPFEQLQADIFDHVYACIREFGLRIYQAPSGRDLRSISTD